MEDPKWNELGRIERREVEMESMCIILRSFARKENRNGVVPGGEYKIWGFLLGWEILLYAYWLWNNNNEGKLVDGGEIRESAGAKYITSVRRNRIRVQVRALALEKSKDSEIENHISH